jgi:hypothetical protein
VKFNIEVYYNFQHMLFGRLEPSSFRKFAIVCFDLCDSLLKVLCVKILLFSYLINGLYSLQFLDLVKFDRGVYLQFTVHAVWLSICQCKQIAIVRCHMCVIVSGKYYAWRISFYPALWIGDTIFNFWIQWNLI